MCVRSDSDTSRWPSSTIPPQAASCKLRAASCELRAALTCANARAHVRIPAVRNRSGFIAFTYQARPDNRPISVSIIITILTKPSFSLLVISIVKVLLITNGIRSFLPSNLQNASTWNISLILKVWIILLQLSHVCRFYLRLRIPRLETQRTERPVPLKCIINWFFSVLLEALLPTEKVKFGVTISTSRRSLALHCM